ncbi:hypothetical protein DESC_500053 [Desulfosarcina cetonica]|nr:hypothetical protein DESC_500053 [Desulfosarcina cetonica]
MASRESGRQPWASPTHVFSKIEAAGTYRSVDVVSGIKSADNDTFNDLFYLQVVVLCMEQYLCRIWHSCLFWPYDATLIPENHKVIL